MENRLRSSGKFSQDLLSSEILQKIPKDLKDQNIEPEKFQDRIIFMSIFNDIDWTNRGNSEKMYFKFRTSQELHGEIIARDIGHSTARETKRSGTEHPAIHIMGNGIPSPHKWWKDSTKPVTQYSRVSVL